MLEELFCAHRAELTAYCRGLCRSDAAAQDMVQEVFLRAWQNIGTLQDLGPSQRRAWLYRTARNLFVDAILLHNRIEGSEHVYIFKFI